MSKKVVWVTGAHGFLGRNLCRYLSKKGFHVIGIGYGHWELGEAQEWGISQWFFSDINLAALYDLESKVGRPETIFHTAGGSSVPLSLENPYIDYQRTIGTTIDVLEFVRQKSPKTKIVYPSSAAVYGAVKKGRIPEKTALNPVSPYGVHKKIAESLLRSYATHFGIKNSIIRFFSLYGNGLKKQILWDLCCKLASKKKVIILYGTGNEIRDLLHIDDAVRFMSMAVDKASTNVKPVNGGTGEGTTVRKIATEVQSSFGGSINIRFNGRVREGDPRFYQADTRCSKSWGWIPQVNWRNGIRDYVQWFKEARGLT